MPAPQPDVLIIGGGIAGLALAWRLAARGVGRVVLVEAETVLASHSSARNAAIWIPYEDDATTPPLARHSATLLDELTQGRWRTRTGALVVGMRRDPIEDTIRGGRANDMDARPVGIDEAVERSPALRGGGFEHVAYLGGAGVLDIHMMTSEVARAARAAGAELRVASAVRDPIVDGDRLVAVTLDDGARVEAGAFVLASGAWCGVLGRDCGAPLPLVPLRRHLFQLVAPPERAGCIVWNADDDCYFRPESGGVLASPGDEEELEPCLPAASPDAAEVLADKLGRVAPGLADAGIRRSWACLRTFAPDRELVIGPDPRVRGLHWLAGFGGRGMTVGVGAADVAARILMGEHDDLADVVTPARLLVRS